MWTAGFPEPKTFSLRAARLLADRRDDFDVVHDNQCLGTGLLTIAELGLPVVATVHHPITLDRVLDVAAARWWRKPLVRRWYGFAEMQKNVARQIPELLTVSSTSAADIGRTSRCRPTNCMWSRWASTPSCSNPRERRVPDRIIAMASADVPLKGVSHLLQAVARLRVERDLELQLVAKLEPNGPTEKLIAELGISDIVHSSSGHLRLRAGRAARLGRGRLHAFALRGLLAARGGGDGQRHTARRQPGRCAARGGRRRRRVRRLVPPGDVDELTRGARRTARLTLELQRLGANGRQRALDVFSWESVAAQTVAVYERACERVAAC